MDSRWIYSLTFRLLALVIGTVLVTLGVVQDNWKEMAAGLLLCFCAFLLYRQAQKQLREKSWLMLEAIRNRDYSFRLPAYGHSGGERILQDTLNQFGDLMGEQKHLMEQRERFYEQILSSVTSGIVVLDEEGKVIQTNQWRLLSWVCRYWLLCSNWSGTERRFPVSCGTCARGSAATSACLLLKGRCSCWCGLPSCNWEADRCVS